MGKRIILASASPRRREIMEMAGYKVSVLVPKVQEVTGGLPPEKLALENALRKANAAKMFCDGVVICADTVVCTDGEVLGKGKNAEISREMLKKLSGKTHQVVTGWVVTYGTKCVQGTSVCAVTMRDIIDEEIEGYINTGSPFDKAGAYGIQDAGGMFVSSISGDYYTVMGLPLCEISVALREEFGIMPFEDKGEKQ